jgi:pimeloyl-ACP methyl ester carboxylesterase
VNPVPTAQPRFVFVRGHRLEVLDLPATGVDRPDMVLLHEGLGSIALWRDFPQRVAQATGCRVVVYSRYGYGQSSPITAPHGVRYMHDEALLTLPDLLDQLGIVKPVLLGHSDGASIALIHAGGVQRPLAGVVAMAPHIIVEEVSVRSIAAAKVAYETTDLRQRLARYHADVDSAFRGWNDIWLHPDFRAWNIEDCLPHITCPLLAIQGENDEYGSLEQIDRMARLRPGTQLLKLPACGHSPHKDQPETVLAAVKQFVESLH